MTAQMGTLQVNGPGSVNLTVDLERAHLRGHSLREVTTLGVRLIQRAAGRPKARWLSSPMRSSRSSLAALLRLEERCCLRLLEYVRLIARADLGNRMRRRDFITLLGTAATSFGVAAELRGETGRVYRIGVLETIPAAQNAANLADLLRGLRERGYVEGQNLLIEYRSADGRAERFPDLAAA